MKIWVKKWLSKKIKFKNFLLNKFNITKIKSKKRIKVLKFNNNFQI